MFSGAVEKMFGIATFAKPYIYGAKVYAVRCIVTVQPTRTYFLYKQSELTSIRLPCISR